MNNISGIQNIGGNIITNQYYKFDKDNLVDLSNEDLNITIKNDNSIELCFPLGINGIVSQVYNYTFNEKITLKILIDIISKYYNSELTDSEIQLLNNNSNNDFSEYSSRSELLEDINLCYFQGVYLENNVYQILLGS